MRFSSAFRGSLIALALGAGAVQAQLPPGISSPAFEKAMAPLAERADPAPRTVVKPHAIQLGGTRLHYRAIVTEVPLDGPDGTPAAIAVTYAYVADAVPGAPPRPVLFVFNGGPGASSIGLHMHGFGPQSARADGTGLVDNPNSLLDVADLVFVDPIGTGVSLPLKGHPAKDFWGVEADARATNALILRWSAANHRSDAPRIVLGESYGTMRALAMLDPKAGAAAVDAKGVVLMSLFIGGDDGPIVDSIALLPSYAATAWYHQRAPRDGTDVARRYADALAFAQGDYATALIKGAALGPQDRAKIAARLAALIGVAAPDTLTIDKPAFMKGLLGNGQRTGQLDARITRAIAESQWKPPFDDPAMSLGEESAGAAERYLGDVFGYSVPAPYRTLNLAINFGWNYAGGRSAGYAARLAAAMRANPKLRVFTAGGYYDLTTPAYDGTYKLDHAGIPADRRTTRLYPSGHSITDDPIAAAMLSNDLRAFIRQIAAGETHP